MSKLEKIVTIIICSFFSIILNAQDGKETITSISSGRDDYIFDQFIQDSKHITQIARKLGYSIAPQHAMTFVPAGELNELSGIGRYPLPHWYDGSQVFNSLGRTSGVLEFVTKGDPVCRSFYSDTTPYWEQISVIMHVMGHNDFAINSGYALASKNDSMATSLELAEKIRNLYKLEHDEVSLFIQWLYSLDFLQDMINGSYTPPEEFILQEARVDFRRQKTKSYKQKRQVNTRHVLSALVHNLNPNLADWKKDVFKEFEKMSRHYPGNIHTKIINEGWATFSQYLILRHSNIEGQNDQFVKLGRLMSGVAFPEISNPYWLGLEAWRNLYKIHKAKPENHGLDDLTVDQRFVKEAHRIMATQSSYNFIRHAFDKQWIFEQSLMLYREATSEEVEQFCGQNQQCYPGEGERALIVLSRNKDRIINKIARDNADFSTKLPDISLVSVDDPNTGGLTLKHQSHSGMTLDLIQAVQTQYILTLVAEKPVSLQMELPGVAENQKVSIPVTITIDQGGHVSMQGISDDKLVEALQSGVNSYQDDLIFSMPEDIPRNSDPFFTNLRKDLINRLFMPIDSISYPEGKLMSHSPTSGGALLEFEQLFSARFAHMLDQAVRGNVATSKNSKGVRFKVMPSIPKFALDPRTKEKLPLSPADSPSSIPLYPITVGQDDEVMIGRSRKYLPGDIIKIKDQNGQGQGEGEPSENDDPQDGEEQEGEEADENPGSPSDVEIPIERWGEALKEVLGLPNLRQSNSGDNETLKKKKNGTIQRDYGEIDFRKTLPKALVYPMIDNLNEGLDLLSDNLIEDIFKGIVQLSPADYVVRKHKEMPRPRSKAVMVVVMDFSGSMQGEPHKMAANLIYNIKALLLNQYDDIEFRYVTYDTKAYEFSEEQVFGKKAQFLGGGTSNKAGYELASKILEEYNYQEWNKYVIGIGDAGAADGPQTSDIIEKFYPDTQAVSFVFTDNGWGADMSFLESMKQLANKLKWFTYSELSDSSQRSVIKTLKEILPAN